MKVRPLHDRILVRRIDARKPRVASSFQTPPKRSHRKASWSLSEMERSLRTGPA